MGNQPPGVPSCFKSRSDRPSRTSLGAMATTISGRGESMAPSINATGNLAITCPKTTANGTEASVLVAAKSLGEEAKVGEPDGDSSLRDTQIAVRQSVASSGKTMRVRINSQSEQIQDPYWITFHHNRQESQESSSISSGQQFSRFCLHKRTINLKSLRRRLKFRLKPVDPNEQDSLVVGKLPPVPPMANSSHKMKSILKQPVQRQRSKKSSPSNVRDSETQLTVAKAKQRQTNKVVKQSRDLKTKEVKDEAAVKVAQSITQTTTAKEIKGSQVKSNVIATKTVSNSNGRPTTANFAGKRVKISSWQRKNLLVKTLSHLDEIRGNQRPVFKPNKINLNSIHVTSKCNSNEIGSRSETKLARIVREAVKKRDFIKEKEQSDDKIFDQNKMAQTSKIPVSKVNLLPSKSLTVDRWLRASGGESNGGSLQVVTDRSSSLVETSEKQHNSPKRSSLGSREDTNRWLQVIPNKTSPVLVPSSANLGYDSRNCLLATSSRQLKLELKNQQVLQQLRRRSNEYQDENTIEGCETNQVDKQAQGHVKDWRRIISKLTLLTGGRHQQLTVSSSGSQATGRRLGDDLSQKERRISASSALRLTASNDESSCRGISFKSSSGPHLNVNSSSNLETDGGNLVRKLSSSSVVLTGKSRASKARGRNSMDIPKSGLASPILSVTKAKASSANQNSDLDGQRKQFVSSCDAIGAGDLSVQIDSKRPVVVNQTDLVELLRVSCSQPDGDDKFKSRSQPGSGRSSIVKANSKQLAASSSLNSYSMAGMLPNKQQECEISITNNENGASKVMKANGGPTGQLANAACGTSGLGRPASRSNSCSQEFKATRQVTIGLGAAIRRQTNSLGKQERRQLKVARSVDKLDLQATGASSRASADCSDDGQAEVASELPRQLGHLERHSSFDRREDDAFGRAEVGVKGGDESALMDPALIGDAIEIFLRQAMQADQCHEDDLSRPLAGLNSGSSSSLHQQQQLQSSAGCR